MAIYYCFYASEFISVLIFSLDSIIHKRLGKLNLKSLSSNQGNKV